MKATVLLITLILLAGCATEPMTQAELLDRQVLHEKRIQICKNGGGVWYAVGLGRCEYNWDRRYGERVRTY